MSLWANGPSSVSSRQVSKVMPAEVPSAAILTAEASKRSELPKKPVMPLIRSCWWTCPLSVSTVIG